MNPSPFHGIFSSLGNSSSQGGVQHTDPTVPIGTDFDQGMPVPLQPNTQVGQIAVDIYEQDSYYIIRAPIAGVKLSDLDIEVDGKVVTIRGTRQLTDDISSDQYYLQECYWGEFSRSITLPCSVDPKKIKATFSKDGILKVIVPKEERVKIVRVNEG